MKQATIKAKAIRDAKNKAESQKTKEINFYLNRRWLVIKPTEAA